jgi:hypothetical protein
LEQRWMAKKYRPFKGYLVAKNMDSSYLTFLHQIMDK